MYVCMCVDIRDMFQCWHLYMFRFHTYYVYVVHVLKINASPCPCDVLCNVEWLLRVTHMYI